VLRLAQLAFGELTCRRRLSRRSLPGCAQAKADHPRFEQIAACAVAADRRNRVLEDNATPASSRSRAESVCSIAEHEWHRQALRLRPS